jgi:hypothetical protein
MQLPCFLEHVEGEALKVAFIGQIGECSQVPFEDDWGGHAWHTSGETDKPCVWVNGGL